MSKITVASFSLDTVCIHLETTLFLTGYTIMSLNCTCFSNITYMSMVLLHIFVIKFLCNCIVLPVHLKVIIWFVNEQVGNSVYYDYTLSVNGKQEDHGHDYDKDYLTKLIVSTVHNCPVLIIHVYYTTFCVLCHREVSVVSTPYLKKSSHYSVHNFIKFTRIVVIFGTNYPDTPFCYSLIKFSPNVSNGCLLPSWRNIKKYCCNNF